MKKTNKKQVKLGKIKGVSGATWDFDKMAEIMGLDVALQTKKDIERDIEHEKGMNKFNDRICKKPDDVYVVNKTIDPKELLIGNVYCFELSYAGEPKLLVQNVFELNCVVNADLYEMRNYTDREAFERELKSTMISEFWSRCEYEMYISDAFNEQNTQVDVGDQLKMNGDKFVEYCGENRAKFKQFKKEYDNEQELAKYYRSLFKNRNK